MMIFGTVFFHLCGVGARDGVAVWGPVGMDIPFLGGLFRWHFLGLFGVLHLVLAWGLLSGRRGRGCWGW